MDAPNRAMMGASVAVPLSILPSDTTQKLKERLTFKVFNAGAFFSSQEKEIEYVFFYRVEKGFIHLPRKFGIDLCAERGIELEDRRSEGDVVEIAFNETEQSKKPDLKAKQDPAVEETVRGLQSARGNSGILQAGTGTGKTVMGIKVITKLGRKALIVVHTEFLMGQWKNQLLKFTDIREDDIGYIWQEDRDVSGKKVVLAMLQTVIRRDFTPQEKKAFGTVLFDECHHLPAEKFSQALTKFDAKYMLGLSATPKRFDGLDVLLSMGLGSRLNTDIMAPQLIPDVYIVKHATDIPEKKYLKYARKPDGNVGLVANPVRLVNELVKIETRNQCIADLAVRASNKGRRVMVFSHRIRHLEHLKETVDQAVGAGKTAMFIGGMTQAQIDTAKTMSVMFCTYQYASEALDVPDRDVLILGTPATNVQQVLGRILRSHEDKENPVVIDVVDVGIPKCEIMASGRARQYKQLRAKIHLPNGQKIN